MRVCACTHAAVLHLRACTRTRTHLHSHTCTHKCTHTCVRTQTLSLASTHIHLHPGSHAHARMCASTCKHLHHTQHTHTQPPWTRPRRRPRVTAMSAFTTGSSSTRPCVPRWTLCESSCRCVCACIHSRACTSMYSVSTHTSACAYTEHTPSLLTHVRTEWLTPATPHRCSASWTTPP